MGRRRIAGLIVTVTLAASLGCASPHSRFYTLDSTATADGVPATTYAVSVGPVSIPASVDRPELVTQVSTHQVTLQEYDRWAAPLQDSIARAIAGDLQVLLGTPRVAVGPMVNFVPAYRVTIDVQRFESTPGQGVVVEAVWVVDQTKGGTASSGRTVAREPVADKSLDAVAAAHSRALITVSTDIAAAIRAQARPQR